MILPGSVFNLRKDFRMNLSVGLVVLNCLVYLFFGLTFEDEITLSKEDVVKEQGRYEKLKNMYVQTLDPLEKTNLDQLSIIDVMRDAKFWARVEYFPFRGDNLEIEKYRKSMKDVRESYYKSVQHQFGLAPQPTSIWAWITYQFAHASLMHLLSNLIFLFLVARLVEVRAGSDWLISTYILGGIGGGIGFLFFNGGGDVAVLGASGSISALIGFLAVISHRNNITWSFFFSPFKGGYGLIYMPAFLLFPVYLMADFTSVLFHTSGVQASVAHSAHIGGALTGLLLGVIYLADQGAKKYLLNKWGRSLSDKELTKLRESLSEYQA